MAKKKITDNKIIRVDSSLHARLRKIAKDDGRKMNETVRRLLSVGLAHSDERHAVS